MLERPLPIVLVPGLLCSARLYAPQVPELWRRGAVTITDVTRDDTVEKMGRRILHNAPPRFALAGLSMGGYVCFEIMRQAPERVAKLALLDTSARSEATETTERRRELIRLAERGRMEQVVERLYPILVHPSRIDDDVLRGTVHLMAAETGVQAFIRQQHAIISRPDSLPGLGAIQCETIVIVGDEDKITPPETAEEIARKIPAAKLLKVPECGHLSTLEQPGAVTWAMMEWLQGDAQGPEFRQS